MTFPLFTNLPEQREGPITVDGQTLVACPACDGSGFLPDASLRDVWAGYCRRCYGGGQILVRAP